MQTLNPFDCDSSLRDSSNKTIILGTYPCKGDWISWELVAT